MAPKIFASSMGTPNLCKIHGVPNSSQSPQSPCKLPEGSKSLQAPQSPKVFASSAAIQSPCNQLLFWEGRDLLAPAMVTLESGTECYDVVDTLGKGTFGEVAKSWRRSTGEMVAIKILKDDGHRSRIVRNELKLLRAMGALDADAAHIVRFLEAFHDGAKCYLVFELLEQNLFDFQKENDFSPLPVRHIRTIAAQVLTALAKLKELSIIHADLKPENIMLVDHARHPFRVKLIDFGSASILSEVRYIQEPYIQSRFYRAPEILLGLPFCEKVDVWSLGCVLAELHLGWPLYPGGSEYDQVRYICETQGLPRGALLQAARKAHRFFRRPPAPDAGAWQLKTPRGDLHAMVELIKRMLAWDSRERIAPAAALRHPFVSLQQLRGAHRPTRYYQLCRQWRCRDAVSAAVPVAHDGDVHELAGRVDDAEQRTQVLGAPRGAESRRGALRVQTELGHRGPASRLHGQPRDAGSTLTEKKTPASVPLSCSSRGLSMLKAVE
uniref:Protein kinase domain-containing protein n=1 Tax=Nothoprocta perdicaria TaxID=30464 RepID=A0A8C6Z5K5_NOTPE